MVQLAYGVMVAAVVILALMLYLREEDETAGREHGPHV